MTKNEIFEFISHIVISFYSKSIKISLTSLNALLKDRDRHFNNTKEVRQGVAAAYKYWKKRDPVVHHAIAYVFSDKYGNHSW